MDGSRFDDGVRSLLVSVPRRTTLGLALATLLGGLRSERIEAKKKACGSCKRRKNGRCKPKPNGTPCPNFGTCEGGSCVLPFCTGKDFCVDEPDPLCGTPGCECMVTKQGAPFCGLPPKKVPCTECTEDETCIDTSACGVAEGCAERCPNPD